MKENQNASVREFLTIERCVDCDDLDSNRESELNEQIGNFYSIAEGNSETYDKGVNYPDQHSNWQTKYKPKEYGTRFDNVVNKTIEKKYGFEIKDFGCRKSKDIFNIENELCKEYKVLREKGGRIKGDDELRSSDTKKQSHKKKTGRIGRITAIKQKRVNNQQQFEKKNDILKTQGELIVATSEDMGKVKSEAYYNMSQRHQAAVSVIKDSISSIMKNDSETNGNNDRGLNELFDDINNL